MSAFAANDSAPQNNFNPAWMGRTFNPASGGGQRPFNGAANHGDSDDADLPMSDPIVMPNRYGREDLIALAGGRTMRHPDGLSDCPIFVEPAQPPLALTPLSEQEQKLQFNINSSKVMSQLSHSEKMLVTNGNAPDSPSTRPVGAWTQVGSSNKPWTRGGGTTPTRGGAGTMGGRGGTYSSPRGGANGDGGEGRFGTGGGSIGRAEGTGAFAPRRGMVPAGRGGGIAGTNGSSGPFNSRALGLYDPRDSKVGEQRARQRMRSTSEDVDGGEGAGRVGGGGAGSSSNGWGARNPSAWGTRTSVDAQSGGRMPEWMSDEREDSPTSKRSPDATSGNGGGSFDEEGRFSRYPRTGAGGQQPMGRSDAAPAQERLPPSQQPQTALNEPAPAPAKTTPSWEDTRIAIPTSGPEYEAAVSKAFHMALEQQRQSPFTQSYYAAQAASAFAPPPPTAPVAAPVLPPPQPPQPPVDRKFYYLDPHGAERGPFDLSQMEAWHKQGYFIPTLEVRRDGDTSFIALGDLQKINGITTPFRYVEPVPLPPPAPAPVYAPAPVPNPSFMDPRFAPLSGVWGDMGASGYGNPAGVVSASAFDHIMKTKLEDEAAARARMAQQIQHEERMKAMDEMMRQREEELRRKAEEMERRKEEIERAEKEAEMRMMLEKMEIEKRRNEINEKTRAEAEVERRREMEEMRREREDEERKAAAAAQAERVRQAEVEERMRREAEERERKAHEEKEARVKEEQRRKKEEAERAAKEAVSAESARQAQLKQQEAAAAAAEALQRAQAQAMESARAAQATAKAKAATGPQTMSYSSGPAPKAAGPAWGSASSSVASPMRKKETMSLAEVMAEQERQERALERQSAKQKETEAAAMAAAAGWNKAKAAPAPAWGGPAAAWGGAGMASASAPSGVWGGGPTLAESMKQTQKPAPKAAPVKVSAPVSTASQKNTDKIKQKEAENIKKAMSMKMTEEDKFKIWFVSRVKGMNDDVDAEILATFCENVQNPDEVEDFIVGYLGESKEVKEFVREYIHKRSDLRSRTRAGNVDDLSRAGAAVHSQQKATGSSGGSKQQQQKKKPTKLVVDGACLGFRATANPNRHNQGEIDTDAPTTGRR